MENDKEYKCEVTSLRGFIQRLAVDFVSRGYYFYVQGDIPKTKDPTETDEKLIRQYSIVSSKFIRFRRKEKGQANVQYVRFGHHFVLLASHGNHRFFVEERKNVRDCRDAPIRFAGYSISFGGKGGGVKVKIAKKFFDQLKSDYVTVAREKSVAWFENEFRNIPYEPWGPIVGQLTELLEKVNNARKRAGLPLVPKTCIRLNRKPCRPFATEAELNRRPRKKTKKESVVDPKELAGNKRRLVSDQPPSI